MPVALQGSTSGTTTIQASATASGTLTVPAVTDTLVGKNTTDVLTNKTLTSPILTGSVTSTGNPSLNIGTGALTAGSGTFSGLSQLDGGVRIVNGTGQVAFWKDGTPSKACRIGINLGSSPADTLSLGVYNGSAWSDTVSVSSTGLAVTGDLSATNATASPKLTLTRTGSLGNVQIAYTNNTNTLYSGIYHNFFGWGSGADLSTSPWMTLSSTGLAVTGALSATVNLTLGNNDNSALLVINSAGNYAGTFRTSRAYTGGVGSFNDLAIATHGVMNFFTNNSATPAATLDASGNLGLGVVPSAWSGETKGLQIGAYGVSLSDAAGYQMALANNAYYNSGWKYKASGYAPAMYAQNTGAHSWYTAASGTAGNAISWTTAMTLDASGNLLVGTATSVLSSVCRVEVVGTSGISATATGASTGNAPMLLWHKATSGDNLFQPFYTEASPILRGSIDYNRGGGVVRYNTSSDAALKNIIGDADPTKSLDILASTRLREFSWKDDPANKPQIGVIAQELYETFKGAVSVGGDQEDGTYRPWAVDKTAFTFHLIAGYQAQQKQIAALEARLTALEA
jgi:hypothetical protein